MIRCPDYPPAYQSLYRKLVWWDGVRPCEARLFVEEQMRVRAAA
jgi:hypothetical protein